MKTKIQETTSVGAVIALSISDPGNPEAAFVPFSKPNEKKKKPIKRNYAMQMRSRNDGKKQKGKRP